MKSILIKISLLTLLTLFFIGKESVGQYYVNHQLNQPTNEGIAVNLRGFGFYDATALNNTFMDKFIKGAS